MSFGHNPDNYRMVTIKTTDGSTIQGKVYLSAKDRVSDLFTQSKAPFIVVVDAMFRESSGKTLFVNKKQIVWVEPEEKPTR